MLTNVPQLTAATAALTMKEAMNATVHRDTLEMASHAKVYILAIFQLVIIWHDNLFD